MGALARGGWTALWLGFGCWACAGADHDSTNPPSTDGGTGGDAPVTGGAPASGGSSVQPASGGVPAGGTTGGATGGAALGGATGGSAAGGFITGGAATGGEPTGGDSFGGTGTGGVPGGAGTGGAGTGGTGTGGAGTGGAASGGVDPLVELERYLELPRASRPPLPEQDFATVALSAAQVGQAQALLWDDHVTQIQDERQAEHSAQAITLGDATLRYEFLSFGETPPEGRSLYLSLHGGGEAAPSVNDDQWANQLQLYQPEEGIYLCPRAPTDTWNLWHQDHIDPLFERLIENFVVLEGVNPNRVYVMGYSAGGDGVYQLGPRMADHWAAAAAMAGHPNEAQPLSLRNIGFTIHVGELDTAYDRNLVAVDWQHQLEQLQLDDPGGYEHYVEVHPGKPHWMDLEDAVAVPWMAAFTRDPVPERVVWYQDDVTHSRFYWLADPNPTRETMILARIAEQTVEIDSADVGSVIVRLRDDMLDLDRAVTIVANGAPAFTGVVPRTIAILYQTLAERGDPALVFSGEVVVTW